MPGHDGKWHGRQDLTSLFLVSGREWQSRPPQSAFGLGRGFAYGRSELAKLGVDVV